MFTLPPKPAVKGYWTDGDSAKVLQPTTGKLNLGWTLSERPPFKFMNWLFWNAFDWVDFADQALDDVASELISLDARITAQSSADGVTADNSGHTYLTGTDVQAQLDESDTRFEDLSDSTSPANGAALIGLKVATIADWIVEPTDAKSALDELADRVKTLEGFTTVNDYLEANFNNHVLKGDHPDGAGNTGLTSTAITNPYDLKFSDLKIVPHSERVDIVDLQRIPGVRDSLGRPQFYAVTTRGLDKRIRFTGTWEKIANSNGRFVGTNITGDYFEITGVLTGLIGMLFVGAGQSTGVDTDVDNVDQGTDINLTTFASTLQANYQRPNTKFILASGKTLDIHNVKVTNLGGGEFNVYGVELLNESSNATSLPGNGFIDFIKREVSSKEDMTLPTPTGTKGGRLVIYRDSDGLLQTALREPTNATTTGGNGISGQPNLGVADTTGFLAGDMIRISEGGLSEYIMVSAIGLGTLICLTNLVNSYSNANVEMVARGTINADHSNEESYEVHWGHFKFGILADTWSGLGTVASDRVGTLDDGLTNLVGEDVAQVNQYANPTAIGDYLEFTFYGTGADIIQNRTATDPDATYNIYLNNTLMLSGYNFARGEVLKLFSDGKFKTNVIRIYRATTGAVSSSIFLGIVCYQTSKPTFNGLELASGNITSNYLANPVRNSDDGTVRHHLSYSEPVLFGANWSKVKNTAYPGGAYLLNVGPGTVDYIDFTFMGKGITFYNSQLAGRIAIVNVLIKDTDGVFRAPSALTGFSLTYSDGVSFSQAGATDTKLRWIGFPENMVNTIRFQRGANGDFLVSIVDVHQSMYGVEFGQNAMYGHVAIGSTYLKDDRVFCAITEDEKFLCSNDNFSTFTTSSTTPIPISETTTPFYMDRDGYVEMAISSRMFNTAATNNTQCAVVLDGVVFDSLDVLNTQNHPLIASRSYFPIFLSKGFHTISMYASVTGGTGSFTGSRLYVKKA